MCITRVACLSVWLHNGVSHEGVDTSISSRFDLTQKLEQLRVVAHASSDFHMNATPFLSLYNEYLKQYSRHPFPVEYDENELHRLSRDWTYVDLKVRGKNQLSPYLHKLAAAGNEAATSVINFLKPLLPFLDWVYITGVRQNGQGGGGYVQYHCDSCEAAMLYKYPCSLRRLQNERAQPITLGAASGLVPPRFHLPLMDQEVLDDMHMVLAGQRVDFRQGEFHFVDVSFPHYIVNRSPHDRATLIMDLKPHWAKDDSALEDMAPTASEALHILQNDIFAHLGDLGVGLQTAIDKLQVTSEAYSTKRERSQMMLAEHEMILCSERRHRRVTHDDMADLEEKERFIAFQRHPPKNIHQSDAKLEF